VAGKALEGGGAHVDRESRDPRAVRAGSRGCTVVAGTCRCCCPVILKVLWVGMELRKREVKGSENKKSQP